MELNREMLEAEFLMQLNFAEFTNSKFTSPFRKEYLEYALSLIKELTEENERLRAVGEWGFNGVGYTCSECGEYALLVKTNIQVRSKHCPNCGAKMKGE